MSALNQTPPCRILRLKDVQARIGLARSTIYDRIDSKSPRYDSTFPKPIKIGLSAVGWLETSIEEWIQSRPEITRENRA